MRIQTLVILLFLCCSLSSGSASALDYSGVWGSAREADGYLMVQLEQQANGSISGLLEDEDLAQWRVGLAPAEGQMIGGMTSETAPNYAIRAQIQGQLLYFNLYNIDAQGNVLGESFLNLVLKRVDPSYRQSNPAMDAPAAQAPSAGNRTQTYSGSWRAEHEEFGGLIMSLEQRSDGTVGGVLEDDEQTVYQVQIAPAQDKMVGAMTSDEGETLAILAQLAQGVLYFKIYPVDGQGNAISEEGIQFDFNRATNVARPASKRAKPNPVPNSGGYGSNAAQQIQRYFADKHVLISWRVGGAVYGTYTFLDTHFCSAGRFYENGSTHKQSVIGGERRTSWRYVGHWRATDEGGRTGIAYRNDDGTEGFLNVRIGPNGPYGDEGVSFTHKGIADC